MKVLRMGTRGSALARAQSGQFAQLVEQATGCQVETVLIRTEGDRIQDRPLSEVGGKGLFVREIERALLDDEIDFAVHSLKDLPYALPDGLTLCVYPQRATAADLILGESETPRRLGTGSPRRVLQLSRRFAGAEFVPIRGNIDTRLRKLEDPNERLDAIVLAAAGFTRLSVDSQVPRRLLTMDECLPSACQGILGIECRQEGPVAALLAPLDHGPTRLAAVTERTVLAVLEADCTLPVAAHMVEEQGQWVLRTGLWAATSGSAGQGDEIDQVLWCSEYTPDLTPDHARAAALMHVEQLLARGGDKIMAQHAD